MKMTGKIKKRGAAALVFVLAFSAVGLSSVYGAPGIETGRSCSLSFELDGQYEELNELPIPVKAELDGYYANHLSFVLDVKIFFKTIANVLHEDGVVEGGTQGK